jgi:hypothetical protein
MAKMCGKLATVDTKDLIIFLLTNQTKFSKPSATLALREGVQPGCQSISVGDVLGDNKKLITVTLSCQSKLVSTVFKLQIMCDKPNRKLVTMDQNRPISYWQN